LSERPVAPPLVPASPPSMIERMTIVLEAFDAQSPRLSLAELVERTGLPRSTVHRILEKLVELRWLDHRSGTYGLGMRSLELGGLAVANNELRDVSTPHLYALHQRTGLVAHLTVLDRRDVVVLDKVGGAVASTVPTRVGSRAPAHATADGKAILAWTDSRQVEAMYRERLPSRTPRTLTSLDLLRQELALVRKRGGVAWDREEAWTGISTVAAPLRGTGRAIGALSVSGDSRSLRFERLAPLVAEAAREASAALFPTEGAKPRRRRTGLEPEPSPWPEGALDRLIEGIGGDYWL
jgi:DNA-binding IclR family transcriptional regulator